MARSSKGGSRRGTSSSARRNPQRNTTIPARVTNRRDPNYTPF